MGRLLTIDEASALTRRSVKTLYTDICRKRIPYIKYPGKVVFDEERLLAWIAEHAIEPIAARK